MNEFEAAMGLCILDEIEDILNRRKEINDIYESELKDIVEFPLQNKLTTKNYSYFPILLKDENSLLQVQKALNKEDIYPRRYFYPSLDTLEYIKPKQTCFISQEVSKRILCLPIYPELENSNQVEIIEIIKGSI